MQRIIWLVALVLLELTAAGFALAQLDPNDVAVWHGQYFVGDKFQKGTFEFKFDVYDALSGGALCYSNTQHLNTGTWGEWTVEQPGVSAACNNATVAYYLEISIEGVKQLPRRRLTVLHFLRADVAENTNGSITAPYLKAVFGVKDLNKDIWDLKLDYAADLAGETIAAQEDLALAHIATAKAISDVTVGENMELKRERLIAAGELAQAEIAANTEIAKSKILEARELVKLNGETAEDTAYIENVAQLKATALDVLAAGKAAIVDQALDDALDDLSDDGIRFCFSDGTNCDLSLWTGSTNITTLGTVVTGTWQATAIGLAKGGTGLITGGTSNQLLGMNSAGTGLEYKTLVAGSNVSIAHGVGRATVGVIASPSFSNINVSTLRINRGEAITGFFSVSPADVVSEKIEARTCGVYSKIEARGARPGNTVLATPRPDMGGIENENLSWNAYVSDTDTVVIRACNPTGDSIDTSDRQTWVINVWVP